MVPAANPRAMLFRINDLDFWERHFWRASPQCLHDWGRRRRTAGNHDFDASRVNWLGSRDWFAPGRALTIQSRAARSRLRNAGFAACLARRDSSRLPKASPWPERFVASRSATRSAVALAYDFAVRKPINASMSRHAASCRRPSASRYSLRARSSSAFFRRSAAAARSSSARRRSSARLARGRRCLPSDVPGDGSACRTRTVALRPRRACVALLRPAGSCVSGTEARLLPPHRDDGTAARRRPRLV